jgi:hypothetical protein
VATLLGTMVKVAHTTFWKQETYLKKNGNREPEGRKETMALFWLLVVGCLLFSFSSLSGATTLLRSNNTEIG